VFAPSLIDSFAIKSHLNALKAALVGSSVYPPDLQSPSGHRLDDLIYQQFRPYFQVLAHHLHILADLDALDSVSRHEFFVCTEAIPHWQEPEVMVPGLSRLEEMLGYTYPVAAIGTIASAPPPYIPSGDYEAYLIAALVLNFPHAGLQMAERWDVDFLTKILKDAAYLSKPEKDREALPMAPTVHTVDARFE
jgi:hypothetical protein